MLIAIALSVGIPLFLYLALAVGSLMHSWSAYFIVVLLGALALIHILGRPSHGDTHGLTELLNDLYVWGYIGTTVLAGICGFPLRPVRRTLRGKPDVA